MLNIKSAGITTPTPEIVQRKSPDSKQTTAPNGSKALNNALMALAMLGMTTLTSCYKDSFLGSEDDFDSFQMEESDVNAAREYNPPEDRDATKRTDKILNALGILVEDTASINNVSTISCRDNEGFRHWVRPNTVYDNLIFGEALTLTSDCSHHQHYMFRIDTSSDEGINYTKFYDDGKTEKLSYVLNKDGSVTEYKIIDKNCMLENAKIRKTDDGNVDKEYANGEKITYTDVKNNAVYPIAITFDAGVQDVTNGF